MNTTTSNRKRFSNRVVNFGLLGSMVVFGVLAVSLTGCIPLIDRLAYVLKGTDIAAPYNGLAGKRTALICVSDASAFGPDTVANKITRMVGAVLVTNVKKIEMIPTIEIEKWTDENNWDGKDFISLGQGVKAERVVAIEFNDYSIHEGKTLHKGKANVNVTVYELDHKKGPIIAHKFDMKEYEFPKNGRPSIQSTDRQFEEFFLARVCRLISNQFIRHDKFEGFADEAMLSR